jgi:hypothetical protein
MIIVFLNYMASRVLDLGMEGIDGKGKGQSGAGNAVGLPPHRRSHPKIYKSGVVF